MLALPAHPMAIVEITALVMCRRAVSRRSIGCRSGVAALVGVLTILAITIASPGSAAFSAFAAEPPAADADLGLASAPEGAIQPPWFVPTPGWTAVVEKVPAGQDAAAAGAAQVRLAPDRPDAGQVGNLMRTIDATPYAGTRVSLRATVRVQEGGEGVGQAQLWMRVDRPNGVMGAFDNMADRPIMAQPGKPVHMAPWVSAVIELEVAPDAVAIAMGCLALNRATVYLRDVELHVIGEATPVQPASPARTLSDRELANVAAAARLVNLVRFFHPSDQAQDVGDWGPLAVSLMDAAEPATDAQDLAHRLRNAVAPVAPGIEIWAGPPGDAPPLPPVPPEAVATVSWMHIGAGSASTMPAVQAIYRSTGQREPLPPPGADGRPAVAPEAWFAVRDLGGGVSCRVPLHVMVDERGSLPRLEGDPDASEAQTLNVLNRSTRLATVALGWGVFQHFYPYFDAVPDDWSTALDTALRSAAEAEDEVELLDTLRVLVAALHDGHGFVSGNVMAQQRFLPLLFRWAGNDLVVVRTGFGAPPEIRAGDALRGVDGRPIDACVAELSRGVSAATDGWRRHRLQSMFTTELKTADPARLEFERPGGERYTVEVARSPILPTDDVAMGRPDNGAELAPGVIYFNLVGAATPALAAVMPKLERAGAMIFDLRGYPADAAYTLLQHLITKPAQSAQWILPRVTRPDQEDLEWLPSGRWHMEPLAPHLDAPAVFITDGSAISYAESILGIVEAYRLGEIVGSRSAGTNGNVNPIVLPGNFRVAWTGMRVLKHDGSPHHGVGIAPTVPAEPTAAGIAAGRDEVLEKAIEVAKRRAEEPGRRDVPQAPLAPVAPAAR